MTVTVRPARPDDAARLAALAAATFPLACPPGTAPEAVAEFLATHLSQERFAAYLVDPGRTVLLAEHADDASGDAPQAPPVAAGYTLLVHGEPADPDVAAAVTVRPTIELSKVYVLADHHGSGVSGPLVAATLDAARATGARGVWLGVNQRNARARRFYEKQGFAVVGTKTFRVGPELHHDHVMERAL